MRTKKKSESSTKDSENDMYCRFTTVVSSDIFNSPDVWD